MEDCSLSSIVGVRGGGGGGGGGRGGGGGGEMEANKEKVELCKSMCSFIPGGGHLKSHLGTEADNRSFTRQSHIPLRL